jgi:alkylated DNA nucleotide flippase Atl1
MSTVRREDDEPDQPEEPYEDQVYGVVVLIPPGRVMSYGDIAEFLGAGGPRQVGQVMSRGSADVPWWRVIHADGSPPQGREHDFLDHLRAEATPLRPDGARVDMRRARWDGRQD